MAERIVDFRMDLDGTHETGKCEVAKGSRPLCRLPASRPQPPAETPRRECCRSDAAGELRLVDGFALSWRRQRHAAVLDPQLFLTPLVTLALRRHLGRDRARFEIVVDLARDFDTRNLLDCRQHRSLLGRGE